LDSVVSCGELALELDLLAFALRQEGLDLRLRVIRKLDLHTCPFEFGLRILPDGAVVQPLLVPREVQPRI